MTFSGVITIDQRNVHAKVKVKGHRSRSQRSKQFLAKLGCFRTVTRLRIHQWQWNDAQSLKWYRRCALLFFKVISQISRSHGKKIADFDPNWVFPDCSWSLNSPMIMKWCTRLEVVQKRCPIFFQGHLWNFKITRDKKLKYEMMHKAWSSIVTDLLSHTPLCISMISGVFVQGMWNAQVKGPQPLWRSFVYLNVWHHNGVNVVITCCNHSGHFITIGAPTATDCFIKFHQFTRYKLQN